MDNGRTVCVAVRVQLQHVCRTVSQQLLQFTPFFLLPLLLPSSYCSPCRRDCKYNHVRIHTKSEGGRTKYFLTDQTLFDSIFELVEHYKQFPLRSPRFEQILSLPVPRQDSHERQPWFHASLSSKAAEDMLKRVRMDGAFLVRPSGQEASKGDHGGRSNKKMWAITFRSVQGVCLCQYNCTSPNSA